MLSFLHRITGLFLVIGTMAIAVWVIAIAVSENVFVIYQGWLASIVGKALLTGWSFSLFYHWANGIRHLLWDAGWGFEIERVYLTGWIVIVVSLTLTGLLWLFPATG